MSYLCERHGEQGGMLMCRTVYEALVAGRRCEFSLHRDWWDDPHLLCTACAAAVPAALAAGDAAMENAAGDQFAFEGLLAGECTVCTDEWLAATGQPSLRALLAAPDGCAEVECR